MPHNLNVFKKKSSSSHWEISISCTTHDYDNVATSYYLISAPLFVKWCITGGYKQKKISDFQLWGPDYMAKFSPGWNFNLANLFWGWNFVVITWWTSAWAEKLASVPNMELHAKSLRRIKMAPRIWIVKIGALLLLLFVALNLQLFGMLTAYKMMELKLNLSLAA